MDHDVFISYATDKGDSPGSKDRQAADMICFGLEAEGIRCWIAPRNILPGDDWLDAIIDAIEKSKIVVLIFSANANSSKWVKDEIKLALDLDIKIIPFRIDNVSPQRGLKILKARSQWLDAYTPPLENHLDKLIEAVRSNLEKEPEKPSEIIKKQTEAVKEGVKAEVDRKEKILLYKKWILYAVPVILLIALAILFKDSLLNKKSTPGNNASGKSITSKITDKDADKKKNDLEKQDDQDFKSALAQNTISAYQGYIKKFPKGRHVNDAKYKIKKLEEMPADVKDVELKGIKVRINEKDYWEADFKEYDFIMVYIPESDFIMGSNDGDKDEKPRHKKHLNGYWMGKTEITNAQYVKFLNESGIDHKNGCDGKKCIETNEESHQASHIKGSYGNYRVEPGYENYPVVEVSWYGAVRYCKWLSQETGQKFKLPTEAQWEKAARGTDRRTYPWGNVPPNKDLANFGGHLGETSPVVSYPQGASFYGLLNMAGNVREWCNDLYSSDYSKKTMSINQNGLNNSDRVIRGGSWNNNAANIRCSRRSHYIPSICDYDVGFRLCMENR